MDAKTQKTNLSGSNIYKLCFSFIIFSYCAFLSNNSIGAALDNKTGTMWSPYTEWSVENPTYAGNPFDLISTVTFTHTQTGATHKTEMFYVGGTTWKFRFTGTKTGAWTFLSSSTDPDHNGLTGTVTISANSNPDTTGFLVPSGNKFAKQVGVDGAIKSFLLNIYMNHVDFDVNGQIGIYDTATINNYLDDAQSMGFDAVFLSVLNNWFDINAITYDQHTSTNPDPRTFERLEELITTAHARGMHVHLWAWGDDSRRWTQVGVPGGINGTADKRLQRYIAARLGPLPSWSIGYGFDLDEWTTTAQLNEWTTYLNTHSGWPIMAGGRRNDISGGGSELGYSSHGNQGFQDWYYDKAVEFMDSNLNRPHLMSERNVYLRYNESDMNGTRRKMWHYAMAGGHGGWWGRSFYNNTPYPNPEQLDAHRIFWQVNNRLQLDMSRDNSITDGFALKNSSNTNYVIYKENSNTVLLNLAGMASTQSAIAIDTKKTYLEIDLGTLSTTNQTWTAPYSSDWAIAIGDFGNSTPQDTTPPKSPTGATAN